MSAPSKPWFDRREALTLFALAAAAAVLFTLVLFLSKSYQRHQDAVARRLFGRGIAALQSQQFESASNYLRAALDYSRGNYQYTLSLAQALLAQKRTDEAYPYLLSLWERQPEDGTVNLELARVFAGEGNVDQALRYYHNAVYAAWSADPDSHRREARLELIGFELNHQATAQAESEIVAFATNLPEDSFLHFVAASLFMQVQDYQRDLKQYEYVLSRNHQDAKAFDGAGRAAFKLGLYQTASRDLRAAATLGEQDSVSAQMLRTITTVVQLDPFVAGLTYSERSRRVLEAFEQAGERIKTCPPASEPSAGAAPDQLQELQGRWTELKPELTLAALQRDPQLHDEAMELVFGIEQQAGNLCAAPNDKDQALLLIAQERERADR